MIDIPDFRADHLDLQRFDSDIGAAFQAFVAESVASITDLSKQIGLIK